jgi:hypothetical protein
MFFAYVFLPILANHDHQCWQLTVATALIEKKSNSTKEARNQQKLTGAIRELYLYL